MSCPSARPFDRVAHPRVSGYRLIFPLIRPSAVFPASAPRLGIRNPGAHEIYLALPLPASPADRSNRLDPDQKLFSRPGASSLN